jgi:MFS family permease
MLQRLKKFYKRFPGKFWVLVGTVFIDMIGGTLLFPFFALYITHRFGVGMTQAGVLLGMMSLFGLFGSTIGGALTDKFGRKRIILFGLVFSATSALALGFVDRLFMLYPLVAVIGILGNVSGPAHNAMVADMLPEEQRNEGYGIIRVVANLSWIIGPTIGGFVAARSYLALFILDAVFSLVTALIVIKLIPETKPEPQQGKTEESIGRTMAGYLTVFKDGAFIGFIVVSALMLLVYQQMYNTLSVFLRDVHQIPTTQYGYMLSASAILVVLTQFWVTSQTKKYAPMLMMAFGCAFYVVGFGMIGFIHAFWMFVVSILIITIGEMIVVPVSQALVAKFAPEEMRGRYMAVSSVSWSIPSTVGPAAAGLILDNYNPNWVWYAGGIICTVAVFGYYLLHLKLRSNAHFQKEALTEAVPITET